MNRYLFITWYRLMVYLISKLPISSHSLTVLGLYLLTLPLSFGQPTPFDFSANVRKYRLALKTGQSNTDQANNYFQLANNYALRNDDSAAYFANQGIPIAEKLANKHLLVHLYGVLGRAYESIGKTTDGLVVLKKAEAISQQYLKDSTTALTQLLLANFYTKQGEDRLALPKALAALRYQEMYSPGQTQLLCKAYNSLGVIYINLKNSKQALFYFEKLKVVGATLMGGYHVYLANTNMASLYTGLGEYEKAEVAARQALAKAKELKSVRGVGFGYCALADILNKMKRFPEAIEYANESLQVRQQAGDKRLIGVSQLTLAEIYMAMKEYDRALAYNKQAITSLRVTNDRINTKFALEIRAELLEKIANYRDALVAYKEAKAMNDSLTNIENAKEVSRIQGSFDLERKQNQIQLLNRNLSIQQLQAIQHQKQLLLLTQVKRATELKNQLLSRREQLNQSQLKLQASKANRQQTLIAHQKNELAFAQQQRLLYLTIVALLAILIGIIGYFYNRQQKARRLLSSKNEEIEQQALRLTELNATKDKLFSLISHDLRSPVASMKTSIQQFRDMDKQTKLLPLMNRLENQVDSVLGLLTNLLDWSTIQLKGFQPRLESIRFQDVIEDISSQASELIRQKELVFINQVDPSTMVLADKHQLQAVIRNLVGNAIKFTPVGGGISLRASQHEDSVELRIQDTGIGMTAEQVANLFSSPDVRRGTLGESGTGLGLRICREMLERQGGHFYVESQSGKGTTVKIELKRGSVSSIDSCSSI